MGPQAHLNFILAPLKNYNSIKQTFLSQKNFKCMGALLAKKKKRPPPLLHRYCLLEFELQICHSQDCKLNILLPKNGKHDRHSNSTLGGGA